jgi:hypothetical protein
MSVVVNTSSGSSRKSTEKVPPTTDGYSTRSGTSRSSPGFAADAADAALEAQGLGVQLARDLVVAVAPRQDDEILEQARAIFVERPDPDRAARAPARREKAVAVRDGAGCDVLHLTGLRRWHA